MRFSKPEDGKGSKRKERRRARERAREARKRRQELERRAAKLEAPTAPKQPASEEKKPQPAAKKTAAPTGKESPGQTKKPKRAAETAAETKGDIKGGKKQPKAKGHSLRTLPGEVSRRLSLAKLGQLLAPFGRGLARAGRYAAMAILLVAALIERLLKQVVRTLGPPTRRTVDWLGRLVTPTRAALLVVACAGLAVIAAQAMDYRAVAIGEEAYAEVASLAQAPLADHRTPWSAHGPLVGLLGIAAAIGAVAVLRGAGRRALFATLGASAAGLLVILGLDLPRADNLGQAAAEYAGADAVLLKGFYIQLSAMLLLGLVALMPSLWKRKVR